MALGCSIATLLLVLVLGSVTSADDFLSPLLSPVFDDVCKKVECGKGTCKASLNSTFMFECECDPGWTQALPHDDDDDDDDGGDHDGLNFLPCVIPNCTLNFSCSEAAPPVQDKKSHDNSSFFDPCYWSNCGGGTCNRTSPFTHKCECREGYYNLLNVTTFPCLRDCALGMDCSNLGIPMMNNTVPSPPSLPENSKSHAVTPGGTNNINWLIILAMSLVPFLRR